MGTLCYVPSGFLTVYLVYLSWFKHYFISEIFIYMYNIHTTNRSGFDGKLVAYIYHLMERT